MKRPSIGFIGGGRVTRILLDGMEAAALDLRDCAVCDVDDDALALIAQDHPDVKIGGGGDPEPIHRDIVVGALHPPVLSRVLPEIGRSLRPKAIFVSLAPKIRLAELSAGLGGFDRVARMIPNAPSIVGAGFNPLCFSGALTLRDRKHLTDIVEALGDCPEVPEDMLEAYAILTAMGPAMFWFQFDQLTELGRSFGLTPEAVERAVASMLHGSVSTFFESGLSPSEVMNLVPVKPLEAEEPHLRDAYRSRLRAIHDKLTEREERLAHH